MIRPLAVRPAAARSASRYSLRIVSDLRTGPRLLSLSGPRSSAVARPISASAERPSAGYGATAVRTANPAARTRRAASSAIVRARSGSVSTSSAS